MRPLGGSKRRGGPARSGGCRRGSGCPATTCGHSGAGPTARRGRGPLAARGRGPGLGARPAAVRRARHGGPGVVALVRCPAAARAATSADQAWSSIGAILEHDEGHFCLIQRATDIILPMSTTHFISRFFSDLASSADNVLKYTQW
jgi:hypothetical protein